MYPAFTSSLVRYFSEQKQGGSSGVLRSPIDHECHLSTQLRSAMDVLVASGAKIVQSDADRHAADDVLYLPSLEVLLDPSQTNDPIVETLKTATVQHKVTKWYRQRSPDSRHVLEIRKRNARLNARYSHLLPFELTGPHIRFPIASSTMIRYNPMVWTVRSNQIGICRMSKNELKIGVNLLLGLPQPGTTHGQTQCGCRDQLDPCGYHQMCCATYAGSSWHHSHDMVVEAIANETRLAGFPTTTDKKIMTTQYAHSGRGACADGFVRTNNELPITNAMPLSSISHPNFCFDVKVDAVVRSNGTWTGRPADRTNLQDVRWIHDELGKSENNKCTKHEQGYAAASIGFLGLAVSVFGVLGPSTIRLLWVLSDLAARRDACPDSSSIDASAPLRAHYFAAALTRVSLVALKTGVNRILGRYYCGGAPFRRSSAAAAATAAGP